MKQSSPFKWLPSTKRSDNSLSEPRLLKIPLKVLSNRYG